MVEQLIVNGTELDIEPQNITRTLKVADVGDLTVKKSNISTQFKLRWTDRNRRVLGMLGGFGNTSTKPFEELRATYLIDTSPVVVNGFLKIENSDANYCYVRLFDGLLDLAARLKGKTLQDLPMSDLDHFLNATTFSDSFTNTDGYIYAFGDFGQGTSKVEYIAPSFFVHTIWTRILNNAGVGFSGDFFTDNADFRNEVITPAIGYVPAESTLTETSKGTATSDTLTINKFGSNFFSRDDRNKFTDIDLVDFSIDPKGRIQCDTGGRIKIDITTHWGNDDADLEFRVLLNDGTKADVDLPIGANQTKTTSVIMTVAQWDKIDFRVVGLPTYDPDGGEEQTFTLNYNVQHDIAISIETGGLFIEAAAVIGKMSQTDFIKDVMLRFGLYPTPIAGSTDAYVFSQIESVLSDAEHAVDFTDKVIQLGAEGYESGLAASNKFQFSYTKDVVDFYKDGELLVNNYNTDLEKTYYKSPFEIPEQSGTANSQPIYERLLFETNGSNIDPKEAPNSLMSINRVVQSITLYYFNDSGVAYTGEVAYLSLDNIDMQAYVNKYYKQYKALLDGFRKRKALLNLSPAEIFNIRFDKIYYLKQAGRYFLLNDLRYKAGQAAEATFHQVGAFASNQAPETVGDYSFEMGYAGTKTLTLENLKTGYFDKEYDDVSKVRILSGWGNDIKIYQDGTEITAQQDIDVADLALTITDTSVLTTERTHSFTFTLADTGSGNFSADTGTITATALSYTPAAVNASAGADKTLDLDLELPYESASVYVTASGSTCDDEIVSYSWEILSQPSGSSPTLNNGATSNPAATIDIPNAYASAGTYTLKVTVTSEYGNTDTDTMTLTVNT